MTEADSQRLRRGTQVRREVLGDGHVDRSLAQATEFSRPLQELVTTMCWNDIWTRPGLDRRTRSLVNLAMLTALNRMHEFAAHVRGAIRNGCTISEIQANQGARLNVIEGRLAIIEKHTGLVKA